MYAIEKGFQSINRVVIDVFRRRIKKGHTKMVVEAGTNGYKGGSSRDCGSRAFLKMRCQNGDFYFEPIKDKQGRNIGVTIACCGDDGLDAILCAVAFAFEALTDQIRETNK